MKITWLGHSAFKLEESTGTTVVTDPYHSYVGFRMPRVTADIVTVSHGHNDHNNLAAVLGDPEVISSAGAYDISGVHILARRTFHDSKNGAARGENLVFKFRMDGVDICHMGDIGEECNAMLVDSIAPVNVLMIPIGGTYTIDAEEAKESAEAMRAEYEQRLAAAKQEAAEIVKTAMDSAARRSEQMVNAARAEAAALKTKADAEIEAQRKKAAGELKNDISDMALAIAGKVVGKELDGKTHQNLIDGFIAEVGDEV